MKKKIIALLIGCALFIGTATSVYASSFTLAGYSGSNTLVKTTSYAQGQTSFAVGKSADAYRYVEVTLNYTINGKSYSKTQKDSASTNASNGYSKTTASVKISKPSGSTITTAASSHKTTCGNQSKSEYLTK